MSKPMSEQMQKVAERYEKATGKTFDQKTNADHIRSMADDELARFLADKIPHGDCYGCTWFDDCQLDSESCGNNFLNWIKQPYGGDT